MTELSSGSVRVQLLASGESGEDVVVKSRSANENGNDVTAVGRHFLVVIFLCVLNFIFLNSFLVTVLYVHLCCDLVAQCALQCCSTIDE